MDNHILESSAAKYMLAVKNKDSKIELLLRRELWTRGIRYRKTPQKYSDILILPL